MEQQTILQMQHIRKRFPGVLALDDVSITVQAGEVHALMGENGAGKSTLIKILTGIYTKDSGKILFDGKEVQFLTAKQAQESGISTIYQELNLVPQLSVAENMFLGRQPMHACGINWKAVFAETERILSELDIHIDIKRQLGSHSTAVQQMVAIARAVSMQAKLVIMDEPTSSLGDQEVLTLFNVIRMIKARGIATIFISHRMDEIFKICDRVTILRDGRLVETLPIDKLDKLGLISRMIGRNAKEVMQSHRVKKEQFNYAEPIFEARGICRGVKVRGIDLSIRKGEVVGLAGLLGAGRTEFSRLLFGVDKMDSGELRIDGKKVQFHSPRDAVRAGLGFLSEDRKAEGIAPHLTIRENMTLAILPQLSKCGWVMKRKERRTVAFYAEKLRIKTPSQEQRICNLSGGNQQKVILARWMATQPKLLILDEPTRGIDVGAKAEIERLIQDMAENGISVLLISSEMEELVRNCDRIVVIQDGKKIGELAGEEMTEDAILRTLSTQEEKDGGNGR